MTFVEMRNAMVKKLWDYLGCPVVLADQVQPEATFPFVIYSVTAPYIPGNTMGDYRTLPDGDSTVVRRCSASLSGPSRTCCSMNRTGEDGVCSTPYAVNLAWAANKLYAEAERLTEQSKTQSEIACALEKLAQQIYTDDIECNKKMGRYGAELLPPHTHILTHCNAGALATCGWGTALGVIREAFAQGKIDMVYADETRPLLQGARLTVWELMEDKIPVTV